MASAACAPTARDASGTRIRRPLSIRWFTDSALGRIEPAEGEATTFHAGPDLGTVAIIAATEEEGRTARAESTIKIVDVLATGEEPRAGIPEPMFIDDPQSSWRSRIRDSHWEVNSGHPDYRIACETPRRKLRYLAALLAKEVVLHSFPAPQLGPALGRLVEVLTITERRLEWG